MFADACIADAKAVRSFRKLVDAYVDQSDQTVNEDLMRYFKAWGAIADQLKTIEPHAPLVSRVIPYAERVGEIAVISEKAIENKRISEEELQRLKALLEQKEDPEVNLDVELAVTKDIMKLAEYLAKN